MSKPDRTRAPRPRQSERAIQIDSAAFGPDETIPRRYTSSGDNVSPPLTWSEPPPGTKAFALICEDPDAQTGTFVHWIAWNIPGDRRALEEAASGHIAPSELHEGRNSFGEVGYRGPAPPPGKPHRYQFHLYALDEDVDLPDGAAKTAFYSTIRGHILGEGVLTGKFASAPR